LLFPFQQAGLWLGFPARLQRKRLPPISGQIGDNELGILAELELLVFDEDEMVQRLAHELRQLGDLCVMAQQFVRELSLLGDLALAFAVAEKLARESALGGHKYLDAFFDSNH
jgi:hypothetical protein